MYVHHAMQWLGCLGVPREDVIDTLKKATDHKAYFGNEVLRAVALVRLGLKDGDLKEILIKAQTSTDVGSTTRYLQSIDD